MDDLMLQGQIYCSCNICIRHMNVAYARGSRVGMGACSSCPREMDVMICGGRMEYRNRLKRMGKETCPS
jgi:hypothetical protein